MYQATKTRLGVTMMGAILAMIVAAVAMAVSASPAKAATSGYQANCSATALEPNVILNSTGSKAKANGKVYCNSTSGRYVAVQIELWEADDTTPDDFIKGTYPQVSTLVGPGRSVPFMTPYVGCNYDAIGFEELYTKMRFSVYTGARGWGDWTNWATSGINSVKCGNG